MFAEALVALDLSPAERPMLDCLPALRDWGVRRLMLAHVVQFGYGHGGALAHRQDYHHWLERCAEPLRAAGLAVEVEVGASGAPADELLALAEREGADLIVIGSRGQNMLKKMFLGSVARTVLRNSPLPVLLEWLEPSAEGTLARCAAACADDLNEILFASDFSPNAKPAENAVLELAPRARHVECVHVLPAENGPNAAASRASAEAAMAELLRRIEARGGKASGSLVIGKPSREIARHGACRDSSLIVVGKRGLNAATRIVIGSTAANLCEIARRPVLMVP